MRKLLLLFSFFQIGFVYGQNEVDALRYSQISFGGSARYMGLAGAMGSIGGDMSCAAVNPAGLARFTLSEFGGSFQYGSITSKSLFNSETASANRGYLTIGNIGIIGAFNPPKDSDWKMFQIGFTYQKQGTFNQKFTVEGDNNSSLLDIFAYQANGIYETNLLDQLPFTSGLAYWTYTIDPDTTTGTQYTTQIPGSEVHQIRTTTRKGNMGEIDISLSGNYMDKVYLGATLGFPTLRFSESYSHEEYTRDTSLALESYVYNFNLNTSGTGVNFKVGAIYLPVKWLRIGLALHTASSIALNDSWNADMYSQFRNGDQYYKESVPGIYNYRLKTPGRIIGSLGCVVGKWGLISADVERVNYGRAQLKLNRLDTEGSFKVENDTIRSLYRSTTNIRLGSEWRYETLLIRGGYAIYGSPFKSGKTINDGEKQVITAGLGYRNSKFYMDLTYMLTTWNEDFYVYDPNLTNAASLSHSMSTFIISAGVRF